MIYDFTIKRRKAVNKTMAATTVVEKVAVNLKLNNGISPTGAVKTVTVSMGTISDTGFDADKALAVSRLIAACLEKTVYETVKVETSRITNP